MTGCKFRALGALFVILAAGLSFLFFDRDVFWFAEGLPAGVREFFEVVTWFGRSDPYLVGSFFAFIGCCIWKRKILANRFIFVFTAIAASGILVNIIKIIFGRARPILLREGGHFGFEFFRLGYEYASFPSGHAATVFAVAATLQLFYPRYAAFYYLLALLVGVSRIVLGAHYVSDVLVGALFGVLCTFALKKYFQGVKYDPFVKS